MRPEDIELHSKDMSELLATPYHKHHPQNPFNAFDAQEIKMPDKAPDPCTFVCVLSWTKYMELNRVGWESIIAGWKLALSINYPKAFILDANVRPLQDHRMFPVQNYCTLARLRKSLRGNIAVVEADVVANAPTNPFENDFDVGLTESSALWPLMPFNGGVVFLKDTPGAQKYMDTIVDYMMEFPGNADNWYIPQIAMYAAWNALKNEVNFKIFPSDMYNYVPEIFAPTDAYFVHLKGEHRKKLQRDYVLPLIEKQKKAAVGKIQVVKS